MAMWGPTDEAVAHALAICSSFFAKRESQKATYSSGGRRTEIDHISPSEDVTTQHKPLVADLSITLPQKQKVRTETRIRWWKLRDPERNELRGRVIAVVLPDPNGAVNDTWQQAARTILQCAKETLGETHGGSKGDKATWFWNDEVQMVVREKKRAHKTWQKSRSSEDLTIYKKYKRLVKAG
ncbi:unnamed protein product [Nippostrongylus brasiliensis]|uniref:DUF1524 domain-containing protein n=1 Tax=Nippostrongylus brasiliensis TaxID=27835 RepID=A0A0N4Y187_NIPBR|nr:unnamed protein product [Nippostrongylus brasiliensis]